MILADSSIAVRFRSSSAVPYCRPSWSSDDVGTVNFSFPWYRRFIYVISKYLCSTHLSKWLFSLKRNKINKPTKKFPNSLLRRKSSSKTRIEASGKYLGSGSDKVGNDGKVRYHPFEDISDSESEGDGRLTDAETCRSIIEVNSKATLMFFGLPNGEVQDNIFWPDLLYLTDENGNIYFQVNDDDDIMQTLTNENNYVQVIIGLDASDVMTEMGISGPASIDFGIEEIEEDSDFDDEDLDESDEDDDYDGDWVSILEDDEDQGDSDGSLGDWAKLETMRSAHPMYFAKRIAAVSSDDPVDFMQQPPSGLAIQGLLRPAFIEEQSVIQKHGPSDQNNNSDTRTEKSVDQKVEDIGLINGHANEPASSENNSVWAEDLDKEHGLGNGTAFYRLEMTKIELISPYGNQTAVEVEGYRKAQPDCIAHSASRIIDRVKAAGEKTTNALKSLCWRCKGIRVEEVSLIGIDSLGFDLRVCSGTQVQTLRFAFSSRATSEYSAERQLDEMLFPRSNPKPHKMTQTRNTGI